MREYLSSYIQENGLTSTDPADITKAILERDDFPIPQGHNRLVVLAIIKKIFSDHALSKKKKAGRLSTETTVNPDLDADSDSDDDSVPKKSAAKKKAAAKKKSAA